MKLDTHGHLGPDMTKWGVAFSINLAMLPVGMLLFGKLADQRSPRLVVFVGGLLFGMGMFLSGWVTSIKMFYVTFGLIMGLGSGAAYGTVVATTVRWFPERRGLASGLAVGALGFGTALIVPIADKLMKGAEALLRGRPIPTAHQVAEMIKMGQHVPTIPVLFTFKVLGIAFLALICLASIIMVNPPKDWKPAKAVVAAVAKKVSVADLTWTQMLGTGEFWILFLLYACGAFSGLMVYSQAKQIGLKIVPGDLDPKAVALFASALVSSLGLANAFGRVLWGFVSDWLGRIPSLCLMFLITAVTMFLLPKLALDRFALLPAGLLIAACYGGYLGTFPSICADYFGGKNMQVNYALLFFGFAVAAIAGPTVAGKVLQRNGNYDQAYLIAGAVAAAGAIISLLLAMVQSKASKTASTKA